MKKMLLIINPNAGRNGYRECLSDVLYTLHRSGYRTTVAFTSARGDAPRIAAENSEGFDRIVCMGGDGTLSETVSGLMRLPRDSRPELGYIPMGTSNDSATTLGLNRDPVLAAYTAACGRPIPLDIGQFNDNRYFTYVAAFGAFTEVSYQTSQDQKNAIGWLAYALDALTRLPNLTHRWTRIEYDGGVLEGDYIFCAVTNTRRFAGFIRLDDAAGVSLSDGLFEVILIRTPETILQVGPIASDILNNTYSSEYAMLLHSRKVSFRFREPVSWTIDGEDGGTHTEVRCENLMHSVAMMVNEDV
ncbi:MAG: YegS/Rv2252/BmrU family lipid kinase [Oscillospiraceae bacterium]|nr:YegS/Rv2252/BmrU family lipid kinase [Oscillospiraceae bacterium]